MTSSNKIKRYGTTGKGRRVLLNVTTEVEDGWTSHVLNDANVAVAVFVPNN